MQKIKQKVIAPLKTDGVITAKKAVCRFDYYIEDRKIKRQPRVYLCEHRTMADIFLESALFDPKRNVLCIPTPEWESSPEEARKSLNKFEIIFREPYSSSQSFLRRLFRAREAGKSILLPVSEDARGMDREPFLDTGAIARLCRSLQMPVCTVTFRQEQSADFKLDVKMLLTAEEMEKVSAAKLETLVSEAFRKEADKEKRTEFDERKRGILRKFLKSELRVEIPVEICRCHAAKVCGSRKESAVFSTETADGGMQNVDGLLRADMTGITLEAGNFICHRGPGALKSLAVYPGKETSTGEKGTLLIYPYFGTAYHLFTEQKEGAFNIQAAAEQMYEIVSAQ